MKRQILLCMMAYFSIGLQAQTVSDFNAADFETAIERGEAWAQFYMGLGATSMQYYERAVYWYRKAAEQGYAVAQFHLGCCYESGQGVTKDYTQAVFWYRKAAEQGDVNAQYNLALCYHNGEGVIKDDTRAVYWCRTAAEQGHINAQYNLATCYSNGYGVPKDYTQAVYWYRKAAEQGHTMAQTNLGICYHHGYGVNQNYTQAAYWYRKASEQGDARAQCNFGICYYEGIVQGFHIQTLLNAPAANIDLRNGNCSVLSASEFDVCAKSASTTEYSSDSSRVVGHIISKYHANKTVFRFVRLKGIYPTQKQPSEKSDH